MSKGRGGEISLKDALSKLLDAYKLRGKVSEAQIQEQWGKMMGKTIAGHTSSIYLRHGKLFIKINSAVVKQELLYAKTKIKDRLNEDLGRNLIEEVVFL